MASEPKTTLLLNNWFQTFKLLKYSRHSQIFKLRIYGKGIPCHSSHSPQLFELKKRKKRNKIKSRYLNLSTKWHKYVHMHITNKHPRFSIAFPESVSLTPLAHQLHLQCFPWVRSCLWMLLVWKNIQCIINNLSHSSYNMGHILLSCLYFIPLACEELTPLIVRWLVQ